MLDDLVTVLDAQYTLVEAANDDYDSVLPALWHYVSRLRRDARTAAILEDMRTEAAAANQGRREAHVEHRRRASELLRRLEAEHPNLFAGPEPDDDLGRELGHWKAHRVAAAGIDNDMPVESLNADHEIGVTKAYFERAENLSDESPLRADLVDLERDEQLSARAWRLQNRGPAARYHQMAEILGPLDPTWTREPPRFAEFIGETGSVARWADGEETDGSHGTTQAMLDRREFARTLKAWARLVHTEAKARLGDIRSKLALFHRFKTRCEWYDRERLMALAKKSPGAEDRLSEELALYLYDHDLNPLIRPRVTNRSPDLLDPGEQSRLYVESKQYSNAAGRGIIRTGAHQVWDMLATLRGSRYEVREAFLPVFRRSGPLYHLPACLRADGFVIYPLLIDLAPRDQIGSRTRAAPIEIREDELLPERIPAQRRRRSRAARGGRRQGRRRSRAAGGSRRRR